MDSSKGDIYKCDTLLLFLQVEHFGFEKTEKNIVSDDRFTLKLSGGIKEFCDIYQLVDYVANQIEVDPNEVDLKVRQVFALGLMGKKTYNGIYELLF